MTTPTYRATKTRSSRPGWSVIFNHPRRTDARGKTGLKVRRGLGTPDESVADVMVDNLNQLLADPSWWSIDRRAEAERRFGATVTAAFYDGIESGKESSIDLRESVLRLPSTDEGYARVMLVGVTGAGKTTLLRHLIGSDHRADRFPSTSTAKTTTADIEIITDRHPFQAAVTFMTEHEVRCVVDECLEAACEEALRGYNDSRIAEALLEHREQRFRLSYVLGNWQQSRPDDDDEEGFDMESDLDGDEGVEQLLPEVESVADAEIEENNRRLNDYVARIRVVADTVAPLVASEFGKEFGQLANANERQDWIEHFVDELYESPQFSELSLDIMEVISQRFSLVETGEFELSSTGWPRMWYFEEESRENFLRQVRWFSSNHAQQFGRLLTPLVDGIRVGGPFGPGSLDAHAPELRLVLLDGEGLGHSAKEATSISTKVTAKFTEVDMILLVDTSQSPLQAASLELLKSVGSSGHAHKLAIAFTHFDQVRGDNLRTFKARRDHIRASVGNAIGSLRDTLGAPVAEILQRQLENRDYYLGELDKATNHINKLYKKELLKLMDHMKRASDLAAPPDLAPNYDIGRLSLHLRDAADGFKDPWMARLGLSFEPDVRKEHWGRVKALTRRIASDWDVEYDGLRPVADMVAQLQVSISLWLDDPSGWTRDPKDEDEAQESIDDIRRRVFQRMHNLAKTRLIGTKQTYWITAYGFSGRGSSRERARTMSAIFRDAAPSITSLIDPAAEEFFQEVIDIVRTAVYEVGGSLIGG